MNSLISVRDLRVSFAAEEGAVEAVRGISFDIAPHRTLAIVGESGSGKTVLSQAILGILPRNAHIDSGSITFTDSERGRDPVDLAKMDPDSEAHRAIRGARISMIFQEPMSSLSPVHTIGDQISEALKLHRPEDIPRSREITEEMLARVGFPEPSRAYDTYPFELSGGLRQRAMIAMALICRPALLIADEPTTALDVTIQAQILKLMKDLQQELGMAILFITHDLGVVANIADSMVVMYRGRIVERGPTTELLANARHPYLKALLKAVPKLHTPAGERLQALREIPATASAALRGAAGESNAAPLGSVVLEVEGLRKTFDIRGGGWFSHEARQIVAVDDVSFNLRRGENLAIVGESGSGKTTMSRMLIRAINASAGKVIFHDQDGAHDVLAMDEQQLVQFRRRVQYIFQDPFSSLNPRMTVQDIVSEPLVIHGIGSPAERIAKVRALMSAVGLDAHQLHRYPHSFSGGQRQRIGIARALALQPEILICDEPVSALDVSVQAQILNLLKDLQAELGLTYLFISHNLAVVKYVADRIGVMCGGRLVELAPTEALFRSPAHPYTKALLAAVPDCEPGAHLDLSALMAGKASDPRAWPVPFGLHETSGRLTTVGDQHLVRMAA